MRQWEADHQWAQQFIPHISQILARVFVKEAPINMDMRENTDLVLEMAGQRIAVRVRKIKEYGLYNRRNEWTIRSKRPSGVQTELAKILYGWGDYYFYGWGDVRDKHIKAYTIIDLKPARPWLYENGSRLMEQHGQIQQNKDGSSAFVAICLDELPTECIISRHTTPNLDTSLDLSQITPYTAEQRHYLDHTLTLAERQSHLKHNDAMRQQRFNFGEGRL